tara:strand:+ start:256 stop:1035 length:780 start_codon:yes stop_codon:yes gene_type:complete
MQIPKTITQVWINNQPPNQQMQQAMNSWKDKNPDYKYKLLNEENCRSWLKQEFYPDALLAFDTIKSIAGKVDLFRYCYLCRNGGIYTDVDNICIKPLDDWLTPKDKFVGVLDLPCNIVGKFYKKHLAVQNSLLIVSPEHPFMWYAYKLATYNILNKIQPNAITVGTPQSFHPLVKITGPKLLGDAIKLALNNSFDAYFKPKDECTPCGYRFPAKLIITKEKFHNKHYKCNIVNSNEEILVQMKYEGYNPEIYWNQQSIY